MGGLIQLLTRGTGLNKYALAFAPLTGPQKVTGQITLEVDIEQLATDLAGSTDWGAGQVIPLFVDNAFVKYWYMIGIYSTLVANSNFYPYDPDTDVLGGRIVANDATHYLDRSIETIVSGYVAPATKTISFNPCAVGVFNKTPLYLIYVMFVATVGGGAGNKAWDGNFFRVKVTQP